MRFPHYSFNWFWKPIVASGLVLAACSSNAQEVIFPENFPDVSRTTFEICLAAMRGIDSGIEIANELEWKVVDTRTETQYEIPQSHRQYARISKENNENAVTDNERIVIDFGRLVYPRGEKIYCNASELFREGSERKDFAFNQITEINGVDGTALTYDACKSARCKGRVSGHWNMIYDEQLIWISASSDKYMQALNFEKITSE